MPIRNENQRELIKNITGHDNGYDSVKSLRSFTKQYLIRKNGANWDLYPRAESGETGTQITTDHYDPPFRVRGISVDQQAIIYFDMPESTRAEETIPAGAYWPIWITRLYLSDISTATEIRIYG